MAGGKKADLVPVDSRIVSDTSQAINLLAKRYEKAGETERAEALFQFAANLELASPELQACWGGPFNGQAGRQAIMTELIKLLKPIAIVETGTFRGISTEWIAQNFKGAILSCEKERLYFIQARARLSRFFNVDVRLEDSRKFLEEVLKTLPPNEPILFYLDAHWELDFPLPEELTKIFAHHAGVVVIDDFRVPDDPGYGWDDYGPQGSVELRLLDDVVPAQAHLYFPKLPSKDETGARRGCCIVASKFRKILELCTLLRGDTRGRWLEVQQAAPRTPSNSKDSCDKLLDSELASSSYPEIIRTLERHVEVQSAELSNLYTTCAARLEVIERLDTEVRRLGEQLAISEADRGADRRNAAKMRGSDQRLAAIVVPMTHREVHRLFENFWLWDQPKFRPGNLFRERPRLIISFNNDSARRFEKQIREKYEATMYVCQCFDSIEFMYLDLTGDRDIYVRDNLSGEHPSEGHKAGPNNQFFETITRLHTIRGHVFLMETDCVPIRSNWLAALEDIVERAQPFWIMGSAYRGETQLAAEHARHINGNAVYAVADPRFQAFVTEIWWPRLKRFVREDAPWFAYDIVLETMFARGLSVQCSEDWRLYQRIAHRLVYTDYIQNISTEPDNCFFETTDMGAFIAANPCTYLLHGGIFAKAASALKASDVTADPIRLGLALLQNSKSSLPGGVDC